MTGILRRVSAVIAVAGLGATGLWAAAVPAAASVGRTAHHVTGKPWKLPSSAPGGRKLPRLGGVDEQTQASEVSALQAARRTGRPVVASALTTPTQLVTVRPDGVIAVSSYVLPVRVRQGHVWVPVSLALRRDRGRLAPTAIPGDSVSFSAGGTGPMAEITSGGANLALWWPGRLPAPTVSGATATYRGVLPGVSLVLTATSAAAGGFSEVLVVSSASAARRLAHVSLRVSGLRLDRTADGGLAAPFAGGSFVAPPPQMWDSSAVVPGSARARGALASARSVDASLAPAGGPQRSSSAAPATGARVAALATAVSEAGSLLTLVPDRSMLTSRSSVYPMFLDPDFTSVGNEQDYDPVQSECPASHWNSAAYPHSPVGYDNFEQGDCQTNDTDDALYQVAMPVQTSGSGKGSSLINSSSTANILSAAFQVNEVYSSDCSSDPAVTLTWIDRINSSTGWAGPGGSAYGGPAPATGNSDVTTDVDYDPKSCNTTADYGATVPASFNVLNDITNVGSGTNMTFRLWEKGNTDTDDHKQFSDNPDLSFTYIDTPNVPTDGEAAIGSNGSGSVSCDTVNPGTNTLASGLPRMGKFDSNSGPFLFSDFTTDDSNTTTDQFRYWNNSTPSSKTTGATFSGTGRQDQSVTSAFAASLTAPAVVGYQAQASITYSGVPYNSGWSSPCYFAVFPVDPDAPTVAAGFNQATAQPVGTSLSFTITQSAGDTASEFVWGLDQTPSTTPSQVPPAQTCTASSATCKLSAGSATVTVTVPSPGPHNFWVYELDSAGNESGMTNDAPPGQGTTFDGAADPAVSYTSGASLSANFAAALAAGQPFDNTMISTTAGSAGTANGDGYGDALDEALIKSAGWNPGGTVTVDGASFELTSFGSPGSGPDNLLSANQTIGVGPSGAQGSAVVFLATSTGSNAQVPGLVTGSPDAGAVSGDDTVPGVMGGTAVTGDGCSTVVAGDQSLAGTCLPASGTVNYAAGCPVGSQTSYDLTVPDWVSGPADEAALITSQEDTATGYLAGDTKIYAYAVPVDASCTVTSVTLPDIGNSVGVPAGGTTALPGLHIFGIALRNTTTATPEVTGTAAMAPAGQAWTAAVASPAEDAFGPGWGDQTLRVEVSPTVSAPAGAQVRIRLSNPGFLSQDGSGPLQIGAASVAEGFGGPVPDETPVALTFGSAASVTIPAGGDVYSNPLTLPFAINAGQPLLVSLWLENASLPVLPENSWGSGTLTWWAPSATPNETEDTTGTPFTSAGSSWTGGSLVLTGVDVTTPEVTSGSTELSPGQATAVVAGDNLIDAWTSSALPDATDVPSMRLGGQLYSQGIASGYGSVDAGMESNQILADGTGDGGVSLIARLDRDVLAEPDAGTVVLDEGLQDLLSDTSLSAPELENALTALTNELNAFGVNVIVGTITPCTGYSNGSASHSCSTAVDNNRQAVNNWLLDGTGISIPNCVAGFDAAVSNGASPEALASEYDAGDHANLSFAGYAALAASLPSGGCPLMPNNYPMPAVP
jgi:hypothetical protein